MASCVSCGKELGFNEKICQGCGARNSHPVNNASSQVKSSSIPPSVNIPKAPAPPKVRPKQSVSSEKVIPTKKSSFTIGKVLVLLALVGAGYWYWSSKLIDDQLAIDEANHVEEVQSLEEAKAAEDEALIIAAEEATARVEEENASLKAEAERVLAEKDAALLVAKEKEEEARRAHEQLKAHEMDKATKENKSSFHGDHSIDGQHSTKQLSSPSQQPQINQTQESFANSNGFKMKFKGAFNATIAKRTYPTESMKEQAQEHFENEVNSAS